MAVKQSVPPEVTLMEGITHLLNKKEHYFIAGYDANKAWLQTITSTSDLLEDPRFLDSLDFKHLFYTHLFVLLIHLDGFANPKFKYCHFKAGSIRMQWENQAEWHFSDQEFDEQALLQLIQVLFGTDIAEGFIDKHFFKLVFERHKRFLADISDAKTILLEAKREIFASTKRKKPKDDVVFALLSAFPLDELNSFYLKLANYYDPDLVIDQSVLVPLNVSQFFSTTSQDILFVLEKIRLHYNLVHYAPDLDDKQNSLFDDLWYYLVERLHNEEVKVFVEKNIEEAFSLQFVPRIQLLELMIKQLSPIYP